MSSRENRLTDPAQGVLRGRAQVVSVWTALLTAIPAIIMAWQSKDTANDARAVVKDRVEDVSLQSYERDTRTWRGLRRILDRQAEDIDACYSQLEELSEALDAHLGDEEAHKKPSRRDRSSRSTRSTAESTWRRSPKPKSDQVDLPADLEELQQLAD